MDFEPHGKMRINWLHTRLIVEVSGPVNIEGARIFLQKIIEAVEAAPDTDWTREEWITNRDFLMTPECLPCLRESLIYCQQHGCSQWSVFGGNSLTSKVFKDVSTACNLPVLLLSGQPQQ